MTGKILGQYWFWKDRKIIFGMEIISENKPPLARSFLKLLKRSLSIGYLKHLHFLVRTGQQQQVM